MDLACSGTDAETPAVSSQHLYPNGNPVQFTSLSSSSQNSPSVMSPTMSELFVSQSPSHSLLLQPPKSWHYDPLVSPDWDLAGPPGILCSHRVKKDLRSIYSDPLPLIFIVPEEENLFRVHSLIIGPFDTPYEGGFFHFLVRFGPQYPLHPPRVRLLTTGGGTVRFNPNLYKNGKVCLSILGTWSGPAWSPASNLSSVLLSLQSLMNENPYHNEPGFEKEHKPGDSARYNTIIMHETIKVAVIQQLQGNTRVPSDLVKIMQGSFMDYYDHYVDICEENKYRDGTNMEDPFGELRGKFQFGTMLKQLRKIKASIEAKGIPTLLSDAEPTDDGLPVENGDDGDAGDASSISLSDDSDDDGANDNEVVDENQETPEGEE